MVRREPYSCLAARKGIQAVLVRTVVPVRLGTNERLGDGLDQDRRTGALWVKRAISLIVILAWKTD